ncbi:hypothetical protein [Mesorhizobium sp. 1M-11]|uniref:hypothetical protein n=1 Tax=Mesorhizobium sp. 1M-11 TaxID=1529006 RepID=UPI0006C75B30|nr:hypothetical protein [Mesorhizobium sp. 1M-11]
MADRGTARPVSGEIMTAASSVRNGTAVADVVDADFIVLDPDSGVQFDRAPTQIPLEAVEPAPSLDGMGMLRKGEATADMHGASHGGPLFWGGGVAIALLAFWVSGGHALFHKGAFFDSTENAVTALSISGVSSRVDSSGRKPVLLVDGEAGNDGMEAAVLPPLEIRVTGNDGHITRYGLGTSGRTLPPGERFAFSSRLDLPRNGVTAVSVTFAR